MQKIKEIRRTNFREKLRTDERLKESKTGMENERTNGRTNGQTSEGKSIRPTSYVSGSKKHLLWSQIILILQNI